MTFTAAELDKVISNGNSEYCGDRWLDLYYKEIDNLDTAFGKVKVVESGPDDPGDGKPIWVVVKLGDRHFRKTGYHSSWDAPQFDGQLEEVEPYEKTVIDYRSI